MKDSNSKLNRRKVLQQVGIGVAGTGTLFSAVGSAKSDENTSESNHVFTEKEKEKLIGELEKIAARELNAAVNEDGSGNVQAQSIPWWVPGLPSALPFSWCLDVPLGPEFCALANSPIVESRVSCGRTSFIGRQVGMEIGYGPSVEIEDDGLTGEIQNQIGVNLMINEANGCLYVEVTAGPESACTSAVCPNIPNLQSVSVTELANELYDAAYTFAEDVYDAVGLSPPDLVIAATAVLFAVALALGFLTPPIPVVSPT